MGLSLADASPSIAASSASFTSGCWRGVSRYHFANPQTQSKPNIASTINAPRQPGHSRNKNGCIKSTINIGAYHGGIEEPYQRTGCGSGAGWGNEFETIRIRLEDFTRNGSPIDLGDIVTIEILCGPAHGSKAGRLGFDDLVLTKD